MQMLWNDLALAFRGMAATVAAWIPRLVLGVILVLIALMVAKLVERLLRLALSRMKFDELLARAGLDQTLQKVGVRQELDRALPRLAYWLLLLLFVKTAADSLGLLAISDAIGTFMGYVPNIVAALLILVLGSAAAQFAGRTVAEAAESSGIDFASGLGSLVSGVILFVLGIMALAQLEIDTEMVQLVSMGLIGALALAFGLSFGLGSRRITQDIIAGFYARKTFAMGQEMEIRGERGVLEAITPTQTLLRQQDTLVAVTNSVFLEEVVKQ